MTLLEIKKYLEQHYFLIFEYKSVYYTLQKEKKLFRFFYSLVDTDNPPQYENSLENLLAHATIRDGTILGGVINDIKIIKWNDSSWVSYEAVRHNVVVHNHEVHFLYNGKYYWIAHSHNGISHLTDEAGNSQIFHSYYDLFTYARIDNKSLKEIWDKVIVDAC